MKINRENISDVIKKLNAEIDKLHIDFIEYLKYKDSYDWLFGLKFDKVFKDPLLNKEQNFTEIINQTFTYYVTLFAAQDLFNQFNWLEELELNIGFENGPDIISNNLNNEVIIAEVFAAVNSKNNNKLKNDISNLIKKSDKIPNNKNIIKYIYYYSSKENYSKEINSDGITIISIGDELNRFRKP